MNFILNVDTLINAWLQTMRNPLMTKIFYGITLLGEVQTIIILALAVSIYLWKKSGKLPIATLWLAIIGSEGTTFVGKLWFHRPRPLNAIYLETSNSFPSGHATIAVAFGGFIAYLLLKKITNKLQQALVILVALIVILAIGFSRLYLGVHYVSDVTGGYLVGLLWLIIAIGVDKSKWAKNKII